MTGELLERLLTLSRNELVRDVCQRVFGREVVYDDRVERLGRSAGAEPTHDYAVARALLDRDGAVIRHRFSSAWTPEVVDAPRQAALHAEAMRAVPVTRAAPAYATDLNAAHEAELELARQGRGEAYLLALTLSVHPVWPDIGIPPALWACLAPPRARCIGMLLACAESV